MPEPGSKFILKSLDYEGKQHPQKTLENKARVVNIFYNFKELKA